MSLPKAVQRQLEEAERLQAAQAQPQSEPPQQPQVISDAAQLLAQPQTPAPAAPAPAPAPAPEPSKTVDWEQKFRTVDGMYRADVPALRARNQALESQMVTLTEQVRALTKMVEAAPAKQPEKPQPDSRDVEQFGADLVGMVQRYMEQAVARINQQVGAIAQDMDQRLGSLEQKVNGVSQQSATTLEQHFYATLGAAIPEWQQINESPDWLQWLAQEDDLSGVTRQTILEAAHTRFDAPRVIAIFKKFLAGRPQRPSLEGQIAPASSVSAPAPAAAPTRPFISIRAIEQFHRDVSRGAYRGREAEQARMEAEFDAAQAEGRILPV